MPHEQDVAETGRDTLVAEVPESGHARSDPPAQTEAESATPDSRQAAADRDSPVTRDSGSSSPPTGAEADPPPDSMRDSDGMPDPDSDADDSTEDPSADPLGDLSEVGTHVSAQAIDKVLSSLSPPRDSAGKGRPREGGSSPAQDGEAPGNTFGQDASTHAANGDTGAVRDDSIGASGAPPPGRGARLIRLVTSPHRLVSHGLLPGFVRVLECADRPFARLPRQAKDTAGYVGVATAVMAVVIWLLVCLRHSL